MNLFFVCLLFVSLAFAKEGKVLVVRGEASFQGKMIKVGDMLTKKGELKVGDKSYAKVQYTNSGTSLSLAANSAAILDFDQSPDFQEASLVSGISRWISGKDVKQGGVSTSFATMGIRGTDFMASYNPLLNETETICFEGEIAFKSKKRKAIERPVKKGQWGGMGGRFGAEPTNIFTLSPEVITHFKTVIPQE